MYFKSDSQRRAMFASIFGNNRFSSDSDDNMKEFEEPSVEDFNKDVININKSVAEKSRERLKNFDSKLEIDEIYKNRSKGYDLVAENIIDGRSSKEKKEDDDYMVDFRYGMHPIFDKISGNSRMIDNKAYSDSAEVKGFTDASFDVPLYPDSKGNYREISLGFRSCDYSGDDVPISNTIILAGEGYKQTDKDFRGLSLYERQFIAKNAAAADRLKKRPVYSRCIV